MDERRRSTVVAAGGLGTFAVLQSALAAGAPIGRAAYGGRHEGRLPTGLRATSAVAALGYAAGAVALLRDSKRPGVRRRVLTGLAFAMGAGTVANAVSPSPPERVWSPVCAVVAIASWRSRPTVR